MNVLAIFDLEGTLTYLLLEICTSVTKRPSGHLHLLPAALGRQAIVFGFEVRLPVIMVKINSNFQRRLMDDWRRYLFTIKLTFFKDCNVAVESDM